jgi:hypothetical protein
VAGYRTVLRPHAPLVHLNHNKVAPLQSTVLLVPHRLAYSLYKQKAEEARLKKI